jgi:membrane protein YdbS with pleckstrin-like domain/DNA-directed RNA polymerase subunit RPC12/RpoP
LVYCDKCGKKLEADMIFCPRCGSRLSGRQSAPVRKQVTREKDSIILTLKPRFIASQHILNSLPLALFFGIWGGGFLGGLGLFIFPTDFCVCFTVAGIISFLLFLLIIPFIINRTYRKTEYRFYNTKLDYYEGFFNIEEKTIGYERITEVSMRKGIIQRYFGLGTLFLATPASGGRSGIKLNDLENPDETYDIVKRMIEGYN